MPSEPSEDKIHALIRLIYEAAADPLQWPQFLHNFGAAVNAAAVGLVVIDYGLGKAGVDESVNVDPAYQSQFISHYGSINPWTAPQVAHLWKPGSVLDGRDIIADEALIQTEFYNGFLRPQGWFSALGGAITQNDSISGFITALRPASVEPHVGRDLLTLLMPHLQTAMRLHERICQLETSAAAMSDAIDLLPGGVIIVDIQARVLVINRAGEAILALNNGLKNGPTGLFATNPGETLALHTTITAAVFARDGVIDAPVPIAITRDGARRPLQILVAPLPPQVSGTRRQPAAILFVSDPDDTHQPSQALIQSTFALTDAEARVAVAIASGKSVEQIAFDFGVTPDTIRTHLKKIFAKTDTGRQGELIRLILTTWSTLRTNGKT